MLKEVLIIFIRNIENVKRVILKEYKNDFIIIKINYYNHVEINVYDLRTWILD